ncbi:MAG: putative ABC exporter domain-containing protein [Oscillospiraceae bacterium]|nr:putative ABC exporter domain-containing protein [Oscillospiraceae bacterium]
MGVFSSVFSSVLLKLLLIKMKNQLRSFFRSPGKLIITAVAIGLLAVVVWSGTIVRMETDVRDRAELFAIIKVFYIAMFIMGAYSGLSRGATFFSMADVNLVFPSPVRPIQTLMYGLVQQLGTSLMIGVFILYQYSTLHGQYAVTVAELFMILLGYGLTVFTASVTAMTIYAASSVSESHRRNAKRIFAVASIAMFLPSLARIAGALITNQPIAPSLVSASQSPTLTLFPFAGWLAWGINGFLAGGASGLLGILAAVLGVAALITLLNHTQPDYYEDVLQATELAQTQKQAGREGRMTNTDRKNVKLRERDGQLGGEGARAFAFKQRLEENRNRALLLSPTSWIMLAAMIVMALFMRNMEDDAGFAAVLGLGLYLQLVFSAFDRWVRELLIHHIYLVPEPPFRKLLYCLSQVFRREIIESVVTWISCGLILRLPPWMIIVMIALRMTFSLLLIATNLMVDRLWSHLVVKWLQMTLYFLMIFVLIAPGVVLGVVLLTGGVVMITEAGTILFSILALEIPIGFGVLYACRNVLEYAELNQG